MDFSDLTDKQKIGLAVAGGAVLLIGMGMTVGGGAQGIKESNAHRSEVTNMRNQGLQQADIDAAKADVLAARSGTATQLFERFNPQFLWDENLKRSVPLNTGAYVKVRRSDGFESMLGPGELVASASGGDACIAYMVDPYDPESGVPQEKVQLIQQIDQRTGEVVTEVPPAVIGPTFCGAAPDVWRPKYEAFLANLGASPNQQEIGAGSSGGGGQPAPNFQSLQQPIQQPIQQPVHQQPSSEPPLFESGEPNADAVNNRIGDQSQLANNPPQQPNNQRPLLQPQQQQQPNEFPFNPGDSNTNGLEQFTNRQSQPIPAEYQPQPGANPSNPTTDGNLGFL